MRGVVKITLVSEARSNQVPSVIGRSTGTNWALPIARTAWRPSRPTTPRTPPGMRPAATAVASGAKARSRRISGVLTRLPQPHAMVGGHIAPMRRRRLVAGGSDERRHLCRIEGEALLPPLDGGDGGDEALGVAVLRIAQHRLRRADLDDLAGIHHRDAVGDALDHGHVVRDEKIGEAEFALQLDQQLEHPRLHRDVEGRDRLVEHDDFGVEHQGAGDAEALALAAGELVGDSG